MVKKLVKYDLKALFRTLFPVQLAVLGIALLVRLEQLFESRSIGYEMLSVSSIVIFVIALLGLFLFTGVYAVIRFYRNLYSHEGYLTNALPVSAGQHITAKLLSSVLYTLFSFGITVLAAYIATAGEVAAEVFKAGCYLFRRAYEELGFHLVLFLSEVVVALILLSAYVYLLWFFCISVGQLAKKAKIVCAIGVYFAWYTVTQILATVCLIFCTVFYEQLHIPEIFMWIGDHPIPAFHILFCGIIVLVALLSAVWFFLTRTILKNKLNIE